MPQGITYFVGKLGLGKNFNPFKILARATIVNTKSHNNCPPGIFEFEMRTAILATLAVVASAEFSREVCTEVTKFELQN